MSAANTTGTGEGGDIQELRAEIATLRGRLSAVRDLSRRTTGDLDLETALQDVVDTARQLIRARYGALAVFDDSGQIQRFVTSGITPEVRARIGAPPSGKGLLGLLNESDQPLRSADLTAHPSFGGFPPGHPPMKTLLAAPIRLGSESLGNLYFAEKMEPETAEPGAAIPTASSQEFSAQDEDLLVIFCAQAALTIHNARLHQNIAAGEAASQRRVEDHALGERLRLQTLMDASPVGVVVVEGAGFQRVMVNREMGRIAGGYPVFPLEPAGSEDQRVTFHRTDGSEYLPEELPLRRALANGETTRAEEVVIKIPGGKSVPTLINATPVYSASRDIVGALAVVQDMTPLEEIEKLRSEFLGIISHELRTPLTAIKGSAATVLGSQRPVSNDEYIEFFSIIDEQADRLRDLVDNLLDMTRIEAGSLPVVAEPTDLKVILEETRLNFLQSGGAQELVLDIPDELPPVNADRRRIGQVMSNLVSNAVKYSPDTSPITVTVTWDPVLATVRVLDLGRGIADDRIHRLFQKFSRVHDDGARNLSGSGLGLAISKGIVEALGGRIWAESPGVGHGATFSFTLPLARQTEDRQPAVTLDTTHRADHLGKVRRTGERTRILVVDEEVQTLRYLQRTLSDAGYQPMVTRDPMEVAGLLETEELDLVLLDVVLPGTDGFALLRHIREYSGVPVVFLTARNNGDDMVNALRMGADDYITKPFSPSELLARIEVVLRRRIMPDQIEVRPPFLLEGLRIDFTQRRVAVNGDTVSLTPTEYKVLYELANHAGLVMTHGQLLQRVWGPEYGGETELVRSFIRNLRRKLGDDARSPRFIFTEPQVGYRMPKP